jgi:DNA-binding GntR family transcriptional regulator
VRQHNAVLEAIEERDPAAARQRMVEHIRAAGELIALRFERTSDGA